MNSIFKKSIELNLKIGKFLDIISNSLILFEKAINSYLGEDYEIFKETSDRISNLESEADELEVEIKVDLYKFMLLPDVRADVLSLIKSLDNIIDATEEITKEFFIQKPSIPTTLHKDVKELTISSIKSAESLILATRSFLAELHLVSSHISKIKFYEHEADIWEDKIGQKIFNGGIVETLAEKMQLKDFIGKISSIADEAELIGSKLTIFTIKREI